MGRPLNKKYFGNRNIGSGGNQVSGDLSNSQNYADDRIGGEGVASINWSTMGSWRTGPVSGLAMPTPTIPGGVTAGWTLYYGVQSIVTSAGKTGLVVGWKGTNASLPGFEFTVSDVSGANALFTISTVGPSFTTIPFSGNGQSVTLTKSGGGGAAGSFVVDVNWMVDGNAINSSISSGSGYTGAETFTVTVGSGTAPAGTIVLTTDTGAVGSATNQENAILMTARLNGGSATTVDIIRQVSTNRYKVTDGTRVGIVALKSSVASAVGEGSIRLVDTDGGTYFATKLTAHKAVITRGTGVQDAFPTGASVKWNMTAATADSLLIDNA